MREIRDWLRQESTHEGMSMLAVHIIAHGNKDGIVRPADDYGHGLLIADLVGSVCDVQELKGKPKLFFINACRGGKGWTINHLKKMNVKILLKMYFFHLI